MQQAYEEKIPIIGICFGHQVVARAMGGRTEKNEKGWEIAVCNVDLSDTGRKLFGKDKLVSLKSPSESQGDLLTLLCSPFSKCTEM